MQRNTILKSISALLLFALFFLFQACETDIQGDIDSNVNPSVQVDPSLLNILANPPAFTNTSGVSDLAARSEDSMVPEEVQAQLLSEFLVQFKNDEMLEYFLTNKGVPVFSKAYSIGDGEKTNMTTVPVVLDGNLSGTVHHVYGQNGALSFVDYLSLKHSQNLLLTKHEYIGSNHQKYLQVTAQAQFITSTLIGQTVDEEYWSALTNLGETITSGGGDSGDSVDALEECDGELITITFYEFHWENYDREYVDLLPDGGVPTGGPNISVTSVIQICVQTGGNVNGGGTGTTFGTTDGPQIPIGTITNGPGDTGGTPYNPTGGCTDGSSSSPDPNPDGPMGGEGNGGDGGAEDPGAANARLEAALQRLLDLNELFPLEGSGPCLLFNDQLINALTESVETYGGLVSCKGETSEDRLRSILTANCFGGGCTSAFRERIEQTFAGENAEEWLDLSTSEGAAYLLLAEIESSSGVDLDCETKSFLVQSLDLVQELEIIVANTGMSNEEKAYALQAAIEEYLVPTVYLPSSEEFTKLFLTSYYLQKKNPNWPKWKVIAVAYSKVILLGKTHTLLDIAGLIPGFGEPADGLNGVIYVLEGDYVNAGISFGAIIPILGSVGPGGRLVNKVFLWVKTAAGGSTRLVLKRTTNGLIQFCSTGPTSCRSQLARILGPIADHQAHHIIPVQFWNHPKIQELAERGVFHLNAKGNGIMIHTSQHSGSHPAYDNAITNLLENTDVSNLNARLIQLKKQLSQHLLNGDHVTTFVP